MKAFLAGLRDFAEEAFVLTGGGAIGSALSAFSYTATGRLIEWFGKHELIAMMPHVLLVGLPVFLLSLDTLRKVRMGHREGKK